MPLTMEQKNTDTVKKIRENSDITISSLTLFGRTAASSVSKNLYILKLPFDPVPRLSQHDAGVRRTFYRY